MLVTKWYVEDDPSPSVTFTESWCLSRLHSNLQQPWQSSPRSSTKSLSTRYKDRAPVKEESIAKGAKISHCLNTPIAEYPSEHTCNQSI